jgi:hypothetical protein
VFEELRGGSRGKKGIRYSGVCVCVCVCMCVRECVSVWVC